MLLSVKPMRSFCDLRCYSMSFKNIFLLNMYASFQELKTAIYSPLSFKCKICRKRLKIPVYIKSTHSPTPEDTVKQL